MTEFAFGGIAAGILGASYLNKNPRLDIYEDKKEPVNKWRWRIFMSSDEVAASSQGYSTRQACIENLRKIASHITYLDSDGKLI